MKQNLTAKQINDFKKLFLSQKEEIINKLSNPNEIDVEGGDEIDLAQQHLIKSMLETLSTRDLISLRKINEALQRISVGNFGLCLECEEPISDKRLAAIPLSDSCISCAELKEKMLKQNRKTSSF